MTYIYLTTAVFSMFLSAVVKDKGLGNLLFLKFPTIVGAVVYTTLAAKGFGLI